MKRTTKRLNTVFLTLLFFITTIIPAMAQPLPSLSQIAACQWVQGQQTAEQALAGKQFVVVEFFHLVLWVHSFRSGIEPHS